MSGLGPGADAGAGVGGRGRCRRRHRPMVPRTAGRSHRPGPTSVRSPPRARRRRRSSGRGRSRRRRRPRASDPRSRAARSPRASPRASRRRASPPGTRRRRAGPRVVGRSPRAPRGRAAGCASKLSSNVLQPSPIRPASRAPAAVSPPMMIGGGGSGTGMGMGLGQRVERRRPGHRSAGPQRPDDRDRLLEPGDPLGGRREVDAVGRVLLRCPPIPIPRISRPPLAIWRVEAMRATTAGWRFMTFSTNGPTWIRDVAPAAIDRIVQHSTTGTVRSPRPMKWSHAQTPVVAGRVEPSGALEPPAGLRPDRAQRDPDREAGAGPAPAIAHSPVSNSRMSSSAIVWPSPRVGSRAAPRPERVETRPGTAR